MKPSGAYFRLCHIAFMVACSLGSSFAWSYVNVVPPHDWGTWRPAIGIALLTTSLLLSFFGYARCFHDDSSRQLPPDNALRRTSSGESLESCRHNDE
jgi:hypothetical protein